MRKVLSSMLMTGGIVWSLSAEVLAQCEGPDCGTCDIDTECPAQPTGYPTANCGCDWFEDFESYDLGLMPRVNGWEEWYGGQDARAMVSDRWNHTGGGSKSLKIQDEGTDQVRRFYGGGVYYHEDYPEGGGGVSDGVGYDIDVYPLWLVEAWVFIPLGHTGWSMFILNSHYGEGVSQWNVQVIFDSDEGHVQESLVTGYTLPLVPHSWVHLEVYIDLDYDWCDIYYDGHYLAS